MAFHYLPAETESFAYTIHKFQRNTSNKKTSHIDPTLQKLVNCVADTELINPPLFDVSKKKTRAAAFASSRFYNSSWFTDADKFPEVVARFEEVMVISQVMDSSL